jgi:hypothetical protein
VPRTIRQLLLELTAARFRSEPGTGCLHPFRHPRRAAVIVLSGPLDGPCLPYQEKDLRRAVTQLAQGRRKKR